MMEPGNVSKPHRHSVEKRRRFPAMKNSTLFVSNLGKAADEGEVAKLFGKYGPLKQVCVSKEPPWTTFVFFENEDDAKRALRGLDRRVINDGRIRVKLAPEMPTFCHKSTKIMVSGLGEGARKWEIEEIFTEFGNVVEVWVARRQSGIAYVYFSNHGHAVDAVKFLNGTVMNGQQVTVELVTEVPIDEDDGRYRICLSGVIEEGGELEVEETFSAFGPLRHLWFNDVPNVGGNVFFENDEDAMEAVRCLDWTLMNGRPMRVLIAAERTTNVRKKMKLVLVTGLSERTSREEVEEIFKNFGPLTGVSFCEKHCFTARISFEEESDAYESVWCLNETMINGREVKVRLAADNVGRELVSSIKVFVSGLGQGTDKKEIENLFKPFGCLNHVWVARQPASFAYVFFARFRDALDAVRRLDGTVLKYRRISVKLAADMLVRAAGNTSKVYISGLAEGTNECDVEGVFKNFGRVKQVWVAKQLPGIAVVYFDEEKNAQKAIDTLDGALMNGRRIRVIPRMEIPSKDKWKSSRVYVGNLGFGADKREIEEIFMTYGPVKHVWVSRQPAGFALVFFESEQNADWATKCLNNRYINGNRVTVSQKYECKWRKWRIDQPLISRDDTLDQLDLFDEDDQNPYRCSSKCNASLATPKQPLQNLETKVTQHEGNDAESNWSGYTDWSDTEIIEEEIIKSETKITMLQSEDDNKLHKKSGMEKPRKKQKIIKVDFKNLVKSAKAPKIPIKSAMIAMSQVPTWSLTTMIGLQAHSLSLQIINVWYVIIVIVVNIIIILMMIFA